MRGHRDVAVAAGGLGSAGGKLAPSGPPSPRVYEHLFEPDILPSFSPSVPLSVTYGGSALDFGTQMEIAATKKAPHVAFTGSPGLLYTLFMFDPDAPGPKEPTARSWLHHLVVDVPANGEISSGVELIKYAGPTPPKGNHRYVFVLCEQPRAGASGASGGGGEGGAGGACVKLAGVEAPAARGKWSPSSFISEHGLQPVGLQFMCVHAAENWGRR